MSDANNLCDRAHSQEELDEWKERYDWRQMKRRVAREENLFSYMDELSDDYEKAESGSTVVCKFLFRLLEYFVIIIIIIYNNISDLSPQLCKQGCNKDKWGGVGY